MSQCHCEPQRDWRGRADTTSPLSQPPSTEVGQWIESKREPHATGCRKGAVHKEVTHDLHRLTTQGTTGSVSHRLHTTRSAEMVQLGYVSHCFGCFPEITSPKARVGLLWIVQHCARWCGPRQQRRCSPGRCCGARPAASSLCGGSAGQW